MGQHALGTLTLPWSTSSQRASKRVPVDPALLAVTLVLALIGVVMVFSASAVVAAIAFTTLVFPQASGSLVGRWPAGHARDLADRLHDLEEVGDSAALRGTLLLILVLIPSLGNVAKGARRWLHLGPINIQPAELAKFVAVIYVRPI